MGQGRNDLVWAQLLFKFTGRRRLNANDQNVRRLGGMKSYSWNLNQMDLKATEFVCKKTFKILAVIRENNLKFIVFYI